MLILKKLELKKLMQHVAIDRIHAAMSIKNYTIVCTIIMAKSHKVICSLSLIQYHIAADRIDPLIVSFTINYNYTYVNACIIHYIRIYHYQSWE